PDPSSTRCRPSARTWRTSGRPCRSDRAPAHQVRERSGRSGARRSHRTATPIGRSPGAPPLNDAHVEENPPAFAARVRAEERAVEMRFLWCERTGSPAEAVLESCQVTGWATHPLRAPALTCRRGGRVLFALVRCG